MFSTIINYRHIPLKIRLMAWWYGYDIADIERKLRTDKDDPKQASSAAEDEEDKKILWDQERVEATQIIWGDGFCGPSGPKNVVDMSKLLALSPKLSALVIGAGLGGPSRVLAREFGVWINAAWANAEFAVQKLAEEGEAGQKKMQAIMQEARLWRYRAEVMRQGELRVCRYLAHKPIQEGGTADTARQ